MTSHHILHRRILGPKIIATETPHLLLPNGRHDVGHAASDVEAEGRVEGLEEDGLGGRMTEEFHCGFVWLRVGVRGWYERVDSEVYREEEGAMFKAFELNVERQS